MYRSWFSTLRVQRDLDYTELEEYLDTEDGLVSGFHQLNGVSVAGSPS